MSNLSRNRQLPYSSLLRFLGQHKGTLHMTTITGRVRANGVWMEKRICDGWRNYLPETPHSITKYAKDFIRIIQLVPYNRFCHCCIVYTVQNYSAKNVITIRCNTVFNIHGHRCAPHHIPLRLHFLFFAVHFFSYM